MNKKMKIKTRLHRNAVTTGGISIRAAVEHRLVSVLEQCVYA